MKEWIMEKFEKEKTQRKKLKGKSHKGKNTKEKATKEKATKEKATKENNPSWLLIFVPVFIKILISKTLKLVRGLSLYRNMVAVAFYYSAARVKRL